MEIKHHTFLAVENIDASWSGVELETTISYNSAQLPSRESSFDDFVGYYSSHCFSEGISDDNTSIEGELESADCYMIQHILIQVKWKTYTST